MVIKIFDEEYTDYEYFSKVIDTFETKHMKYFYENGVKSNDFENYDKWCQELNVYYDYIQKRYGENLRLKYDRCPRNTEYTLDYLKAKIKSLTELSVKYENNQFTQMADLFTEVTFYLYGINLKLIN